MNDKWETAAEKKKIIDKDQNGKLQDLWEKMKSEGLILTSSASNPLINLKKEMQLQKQKEELDGEGEEDHKNATSFQTPSKKGGLDTTLSRNGYMSLTEMNIM